jgi:hypothetical protein
MTVLSAAWIDCNHLDKEKPRGQACCREKVTDGSGSHGAPRTPGLPESTWLWTKADARREARKLGWAIGVHADGSPGGILDYCPAHKDAATGSASGRGGAS